MNKRYDIAEKKDFILDCIAKEFPKAKICQELKCRPDTLNYWLKQMDIIYKGQQFKGLKGGSNKKSALEYLKSPYAKSHIIKLKLIEDGLKEHKCEKCDLKEWNNKPIPLELHHIDGNRFNNNLENLQILCPNCHAQEDNNSGKAIGSYKPT